MYTKSAFYFLPKIVHIFCISECSVFVKIVHILSTKEVYAVQFCENYVVFMDAKIVIYFKFALFSMYRTDLKSVKMFKVH